jgi:hypothetical protein
VSALGAFPVEVVTFSDAPMAVSRHLFTSLPGRPLLSVGCESGPTVLRTLQVHNSGPGDAEIRVVAAGDQPHAALTLLRGMSFNSAPTPLAYSSEDGFRFHVVGGIRSQVWLGAMFEKGVGEPREINAECAE